MRLSIALLIFLILLNGWAAILQDPAYGIADNLGINAETGDPEELQQAQSAAQNTSIGSGGVFESVVGGVLTMLGNFRAIFVGLNPAVQMLSNIIPSGIGQELVVWVFSILEIIIFIDIANYVRGLA